MKPEKKKEKKSGKRENEEGDQEEGNQKLGDEFDKILADPIALLCFKPIGSISEGITITKSEKFPNQVM